MFMVSIGDGIGDMEGALGAGMKFIGVEQGFVKSAEWAKHGVLSLPGVKELVKIAASVRSNRL